MTSGPITASRTTESEEDERERATLRKMFPCRLHNDELESFWAIKEPGSLVDWEVRKSGNDTVLNRLVGCPTKDDAGSALSKLAHPPDLRQRLKQCVTATIAGEPFRESACDDLSNAISIGGQERLKEDREVWGL